MRGSLMGVAALSRLGVLSSKKLASYEKLEDDSNGSFTLREKRKSRRVSLMNEGLLKAEIEEENRKRAARYVADDKWEEATVSQASIP